MSADINLQFCSAQNVFGNGTTVQSTDWIDWKVAQDLGGGNPPVVEIIVTTTAAGGTSMQFQLCAVNSAGANPVVLDSTPAIAIAQLVAPAAGTPPPSGGKVIHLRMSPKTSLPAATLTHLRLQTVNVGNNSAGAISAHLIPEAAAASPTKAYAAGY